MRRSALLLLLLFAASALAAEHEPLRARNSFKTPEEVVRYYCARDGEGFIWSGMLDVERSAFTLWKEAPQQDAFFIARKFDVQSARYSPSMPDRAKVEVRYDLVGISDAHGTRMPVDQSDYSVFFELKKVGAVWKIVTPDFNAIAPIVLESKIKLTGEHDQRRGGTPDPNR